MIQFNYNDGGRSNHFQSKNVGDCVTRAIAIASGLEYMEVYNTIKAICGYSPRNGVYTKDIRKVITQLGGRWTPLMKIGAGCKVHVTEEELPMQGRFVLSLSKHCTALIDGVINDTYDCSRDGKRCVYGYYQFG